MDKRFIAVNTTTRSFTSGGRPFSGGCLPKDLAATIAFVKEQGVNPKLLEAVAEINETMKNAGFNP